MEGEKEKTPSFTRTIVSSRPNFERDRYYIYHNEVRCGHRSCQRFDDLCRRPFIRNLGTFAVNIIKPRTIHRDPPSSHRFDSLCPRARPRERKRERTCACTSS